MQMYSARLVQSARHLTQHPPMESKLMQGGRAVISASRLSLSAQQWSQFTKKDDPYGHHQNQKNKTSSACWGLPSGLLAGGPCTRRSPQADNTHTHTHTEARFSTRTEVPPALRSFSCSLHSRFQRLYFIGDTFRETIGKSLASLCARHHKAERCF